MSGSTISTTITIAVTLGSAGYGSPLTISATGEVAPTVSGSVALFGTAAGGLIFDNRGTLSGAPGSGAGANLTGVTGTNEGLITGGSGGGLGGNGIILGAAAALTNTGTILAGSAGAGPLGGGGSGASVAAGATLTNAGTLTGGNGGTGPRPGYNGQFFGGPGGSGVFLTGGTVVNTGQITGGNGAGGSDESGVGGPGAYVSSGVLIDFGTISSGAPAGAYAKYAVEVANGTLVVEPGAVFNGQVSEVNRDAGLLDFAATTLATTLGGFGTEYLNFQEVAVEAGPGWTIASTVSQGFLLHLGAGATLSNEGTISGGVTLATGATLSNDGTLTSGTGVGVDLAASALVINHATIKGFNQRSNFYADPGAGMGGIGATLAGGATLINEGTLSGGGGGRYYPSLGAAGGGAGVVLAAGATLVNHGTILGGIGGAGKGTYGLGATAVVLAPGDSFANDGTILGGNAGGAGLDATGLTAADIFTDAGQIAGGFGNSDAVAGTGVLLGRASLINSGTIAGGSGVQGGTNQDGGIGAAGVSITGGELTNDGLVSGGTGGGIIKGMATLAGAGAAGVSLTAGTLVNAGTILGGGGGFGVDETYPGQAQQTGGAGAPGVDLVGGVLINSGSVVGGAGGYTVGISGAAAAGVRVSGNATLINEGQISGGQADFNAAGGAGVYLDGGTVVDAGTIAGALADIDRHTVQADAVQFGSLAGLLVVSAGAVLQGPIGGFTTADTIDAAGFVAQTSSYLNGTLTLGAADGGSMKLDLPGFAGIGNFIIAPDGATGTDVAVAACFHAGTRIATPGGEVAIEALAIGDAVITASGAVRPVRWIGRRSYDGSFVAGNRNVLPILIRQAALAQGVPARDLLVSPKHAMFLDGVLIPAELLVNGRSVVRLPAVASLSYFHIELDSHDVLLAEGAGSESFVDCDSRMMFQNAHEFSELYPDDASPSWRFCAPRIEAGEVLARVRRRLAARAGLAADHVEDAPHPGPLEGCIDVLDHGMLSGWAFDPSRPHSRVHLEIQVDGAVVASVYADGFREDLRQARKGDGRHAFTARLPRPLSPAADHVVDVRRVADQAMLAQARLAADPVRPGPLDGRVDVSDGITVEGWALDEHWPDRPVRLDVLDGSRVIGQARASRYRPDLERAGKAGGLCGFVFRIDPALPLPNPLRIRVRRATDRASLPDDKAIFFEKKKQKTFIT